MFLATWNKGARALGCFYGALDFSPYGIICKRTSGTYSITVRATWLCLDLSMRTFSSLLEVTIIGARMPCRIRYSAASVPLCIDYASLCHQEGGLYICLSSESNGPNLLDEPMKGFIVNPTDLPWKWVKRLATSGERVNHDS